MKILISIIIICASWILVGSVGKNGIVTNIGYATLAPISKVANTENDLASEEGQNLIKATHGIITFFHDVTPEDITKVFEYSPERFRASLSDQGTSIAELRRDVRKTLLREAITSILTVNPDADPDAVAQLLGYGSGDSLRVTLSELGISWREMKKEAERASLMEIKGQQLVKALHNIFRFNLDAKPEDMAKAFGYGVVRFRETLSILGTSFAEIKASVRKALLKDAVSGIWAVNPDADPDVVAWFLGYGSIVSLQVTLSELGISWREMKEEAKQTSLREINGPRLIKSLNDILTFIHGAELKNIAEVFGYGVVRIRESLSDQGTSITELRRDVRKTLLREALTSILTINPDADPDAVARLLGYGSHNSLRGILHKLGISWREMKEEAKRISSLRTEGHRLVNALNNILTFKLDATPENIANVFGYSAVRFRETLFNLRTSFKEIKRGVRTDLLKDAISGILAINPDADPDAVAHLLGYGSGVSLQVTLRKLGISWSEIKREVLAELESEALSIESANQRNLHIAL